MVEYPFALDVHSAFLIKKTIKSGDCGSYTRNGFDCDCTQSTITIVDGYSNRHGKDGA
jgi:hypothetical protein